MGVEPRLDLGMLFEIVDASDVEGNRVPDGLVSLVPGAQAEDLVR